MVPAHRTARIRRHDPAPAGTQRELCAPDREELHSLSEAHHLATLRTTDAAALCGAARCGARGRAGRCRHDGHLALQHADEHRKYRKSFCYSGSEEDHRRSAAQPEPDVQQLHRRRVQPSGALGGHVGSGESGQQSLQPPIYIW